MNVNSNENDGKIDDNEVCFEMRRRINTAVRHQLIADVSVGTFLSGGIDSSIVTAESALSGSNVDAFCMGFPEANFDETKYAREVARHVGVNLHSDMADADLVKRLWKRFKTWFDEPFGDSTAYTNYQVSVNIRKFVKVALSGDGGDEVFGGYERYKLFAQAKDITKGNCLLKKLYKHSGWDKYLPLEYRLKYQDEVEEYALLSGFVFEPHVLMRIREIRKNLGIPNDYDPLWHFRKFYNSDLPRITMAQVIDMNSYLPSGMLPKVDRTSMATSLEVRVPLLDKDVVEYAFSLPQNIRCTAMCLKRILKEAYKEILPQNILNRKKKGFSIPETYFTKAGIGFKERVLRDLWDIKLM